MGANTTVYLRGDNLEKIKSLVKPGKTTKNELINIAVEEYLKNLEFRTDLIEFLKVNPKVTAEQILKHLEEN